MLIQLNLPNLPYSHHKICENAERSLTCISSGIISASKQEKMGGGDFLLELIVPQVWAIGAGGPPLGRQQPLSGLVPLGPAPFERLGQFFGPQSSGRPPGFFQSEDVLPPGLLKLLSCQLLA